MITLLCPECGQAFTPTKPGRQAFCCVEHKTRFHNVMKARGQVVLPLLLARSMGRHSKGDQLGGYCRRNADALIARWNQDDKKAGRRPDLVARTKMDMAWSSVDVG